MVMFAVTGVRRPRLNTGAVDQLADNYASLATAAGEAHSDTDGAVGEVLASNNGPAASAFEAQLRGGGSIVQHIADLQAAALRTESAYRTASVSGGGAQTAMIALGDARGQTYWNIVYAQPYDHDAAQLLIESTRTELRQLESEAVTAIDEAFGALDLPDRFSVHGGDKDGYLDDGITAEWANMSDDERKKVLQNIADAYADANGYPRIKVNFKPIESDPGTVTWGYYSDGLLGFGQELRLNSDELDNPHLLNTVVHEMEHRGQFQGMGTRMPWQDERAGMTREEAERWRELNAGHVRERGGPDYWDYYPPRPIEVGARDAGRDFVNNMTYEEFLEYK